jgi:hypothetical protein
MMMNFRTLAIAMTVLISLPVAAQTQTPKGEHATTENARVERATERCRQNLGVDCKTGQGLKEWLLLDRSRNEAVREGSRHLLPKQHRLTPSRP